MKKKLVAGLLVSTMLATMFAGCGESNGTNGGSDTQKA